MGAGESSWSRWTSTSAIEERGEIGIFGNKNFFKKKRKEAGLPAAGGQTRRTAGQTRPASGLVWFIFFIFFNFFFFKLSF